MRGLRIAIVLELEFGAPFRPRVGALKLLSAPDAGIARGFGKAKFEAEAEKSSDGAVVMLTDNELAVLGSTTATPDVFSLFSFLLPWPTLPLPPP